MAALPAGVLSPNDVKLVVYGALSIIGAIALPILVCLGACVLIFWKGVNTYATQTAAAREEAAAAREEAAAARALQAEARR